MSNSTTPENTSFTSNTPTSTTTPASTSTPESTPSSASTTTTTRLSTAEMMQQLFKKYGWDNPRNSPNRVAYSIGTEYSYYQRNYEAHKERRASAQRPTEAPTEGVNRRKIDARPEREKSEPSEAAKEVERILRKYASYTKK